MKYYRLLAQAIASLIALAGLSSCSTSLQTEGRIFPVFASPSKPKSGGITAGVGINTHVSDQSGFIYSPTITAQGLFFYTLNNWLFTEGNVGIGVGKSKGTSDVSATLSPGIGVFHEGNRITWLGSSGLSYYSDRNASTSSFTDLNGNPITDVVQTIQMKYLDAYLKLAMKIRLDETNHFRFLAGLYTTKNLHASSRTTTNLSNNPWFGPDQNLYLLGQPKSTMVQSVIGLEFEDLGKTGGFVQAGYGVIESPNPNRYRGNFFTANRLHVTAGVHFPLSF